MVYIDLYLSFLFLVRIDGLIRAIKNSKYSEKFEYLGEFFPLKNTDKNTALQFYGELQKFRPNVLLSVCPNNDKSYTFRDLTKMEMVFVVVIHTSRYDFRVEDMDKKAIFNTSFFNAFIFLPFGTNPSLKVSLNNNDRVIVFAKTAFHFDFRSTPKVVMKNGFFSCSIKTNLDQFEIYIGNDCSNFSLISFYSLNQTHKVFYTYPLSQLGLNKNNIFHIIVKNKNLKIKSRKFYMKSFEFLDYGKFKQIKGHSENCGSITIETCSLWSLKYLTYDITGDTCVVFFPEPYEFIHCGLVYKVNIKSGLEEFEDSLKWQEERSYSNIVLVDEIFIKVQNKIFSRFSLYVNEFIRSKSASHILVIGRKMKSYSIPKDFTVGNCYTIVNYNKKIKRFIIDADKYSDATYRNVVFGDSLAVYETFHYRNTLIDGYAEFDLYVVCQSLIHQSWHLRHIESNIHTDLLQVAVQKKYLFNINIEAAGNKLALNLFCHDIFNKNIDMTVKKVDSGFEVVFEESSNIYCYVVFGKHLKRYYGKLIISSLLDVDFAIERRLYYVLEMKDIFIEVPRSFTVKEITDGITNPCGYLINFYRMEDTKKLFLVIFTAQNNDKNSLCHIFIELNDKFNRTVYRTEYYFENANKELDYTLLEGREKIAYYIENSLGTTELMYKKYNVQELSNIAPFSQFSFILLILFFCHYLK